MSPTYSEMVQKKLVCVWVCVIYNKANGAKYKQLNLDNRYTGVLYTFVATFL